MDVKPHGLPRVGRHVEDSCVHADCVLRAYLDTVPAIDADPQIDVEPDRVLLDVGVRVLTGHDGDALGRAHCLAEHAPHAAGGVILAEGEPVAAAEPRHEWPELLGILDGRRGGKVLETAQQVSRVEKEVTEEVGKGDLETAEDLRDVEPFPESQLGPADNSYGHSGRLSEKDQRHGC